VCFGARMALRGSGQIAHDFFLAGACQIPLAVFNLAVLLFGFNNGNVLGVIAVFALCFVILMLFVGLTKIYRLSEQVSAFAVPIMLILGGFVGKLIFSGLVSHMGPQTTPFAF